MQALPFASPFGRPRGRTSLYAEVGVETALGSASPHRLVAMLFEGYFESVAKARGAMRTGQIEQRSKAIGRAARIVDEGLKAALNMEAGGTLAADLNDLYAYVTMRLTQANLHNDEAALDECVRLVKPLHEAWTAIGSPP